MRMFVKNGTQKTVTELIAPKDVEKSPSLLEKSEMELTIHHKDEKNCGKEKSKEFIAILRQCTQAVVKRSLDNDTGQLLYEQHRCMVTGDETTRKLFTINWNGQEINEIPLELMSRVSKPAVEEAPNSTQLILNCVFTSVQHDQPRHWFWLHNTLKTGSDASRILFRDGGHNCVLTSLLSF